MPNSKIYQSQTDPDYDDRKESEAKETQQDSDEDDCAIKKHPSYEQVMLDVSRCAGRLQHLKGIYFHRTDDDEPPEDLTEDFENQSDVSSNSSETFHTFSEHHQDNDFSDTSQIHQRLILKESQDFLKKKLANLIVKLLIKNQDLHYYQGFHDVCLTYMTILGDKVAFDKLNSLIDTHFRTFMQPTMDETQEFLALIPIIIGLQDKQVQLFLDRSEVGTIFALSWVITWFSHVIPSEIDVETIFSFLENKDPHMVLYLCAAIVLNKKGPLLKLEPEMSTIHHYLCQVPRKEKLSIDYLITDSTRLFVTWSPDYVKRRLDDQRRAKMRVDNYPIFTLSTFTNSMLGSTIKNIITSNAKTAIFVLVFASALALQFDRWSR